MMRAMRLQPRSCAMWLVIALLLAAFAVPASADSTLYTNGPFNGTINAWAINSGFAVADSFTLSGNSILTSVDLGVQRLPGDNTTTLDWAITTGIPFTGSSVTLFSGTSAFSLGMDLGTNNGFDLNLASISLGGVSLGAGTYFLTLQNAFGPNGGGGLFWDQNNGPSIAYDRDQDGNGFLLSGSGCTTSPGATCSETFTINGTSTSIPEPGTLAVLGAGLAGLLGVWGRRRQ